MQSKSHIRYIGLTDAEVLASRERYGDNTLTPHERESVLRLFISKFTDPLIMILLIVGMLSVGISFYEYIGLGKSARVFFEPVGIFVAILLATGLAFIFEQRANKKFNLLNAVNDDEPVEVVRNGGVTQVKKRDIVCGDIVILEAGSGVPADGQIIESTNLSVDESALTGEPIAYKYADALKGEADATFPCDRLLRNTKVMEGHCVMRVTAVGDATESGKMMDATRIDDSVKTPLNEQLDRLGRLVTNVSYTFAGMIIVAKLLLYFHWAPLAWLLLVPVVIFFCLVIFRFDAMGRVMKMLLMAGFFVFFVGLVLLIDTWLMTGSGYAELMGYTLQTLLIAVTLIVVAVPEGLPMAVTLSLAYSMQSMLKTNNLVRKLHACETMGATTVICTDKTGTLTQNRMEVSSSLLVGAEENRMPTGEAGKIFVNAVAINSTVQLDLSGGEPVAVGNPTEGATILWLYRHGIDYTAVRLSAEVEQEMPFSTERKIMATVARIEGGKRYVFVKGAPEIVMTMCDMSEVDFERHHQSLSLSQQRGLRTLGYAYKEVGEKEIDLNSPDALSGLSYQGFVAISDPVRQDVATSVAECKAAGIDIKIVTGDNVVTAREIAREIGLWDDNRDGDDNIITGVDFALLTDEELSRRVMSLKIIARARPMDKKRLVMALQAQNQVVAVTGDGTNDAPALRAAHVGLSMGDGTTVAKEASDITILDNSFASIGKAVLWGRSLYKNIQRFLLFQLTVNVTACLTVLAGALMGTQSPLTVTQMLWVNLIMDTFGAMALASLPPERSVMNEPPRNRGEMGQGVLKSMRNGSFIITRQMWANILGVGLAFTLLMLIMLGMIESYDIRAMVDFLNPKQGVSGEITPYELTLFFTTFVMTHFFYMFSARAFSTGKSIFRLATSRGFVTIAVIIVIGQIVIVELLGDIFDVVPLSMVDWVVITVLSSMVIGVREVWSWLKSYRKNAYGLGNLSR